MGRITVTDDTSIPRTITFGGSPLVNWYLYVRAGDLYIQHEYAGIIESPEAQIVTATLQAVVDVDVIVDPTDATVAKMYVLLDGGAVYVIDVTSDPVGEQPTLQNIDDSDNYNFETPDFDNLETFEYGQGWPVTPESATYYETFDWSSPIADEFEDFSSGGGWPGT